MWHKKDEHTHKKVLNTLCVNLFGVPDFECIRQCGRVGFREITSRAQNHYDVRVEGLEDAIKRSCSSEPLR